MATDAPVGRPISLYPILAVNFVGTLGFGIVLPFLVFLVLELGGNAVVYGLLGATYSLFQLVGAPILGRWSDRRGRKRVLLWSQLGTLASWGIFLVALAMPATAMLDIAGGPLGAFTLTVPLAVLFGARALDGLTGGNVSVANAYLADITDEPDRASSFGKMAISSNLGYILGPALAGLLGATAMGVTLPVLAAFAISLVAAIMIAFGLHDVPLCSLVSDPEQTNVRKVFGQEQRRCFRTMGESLPTAAILRMPHVGLLLTLHFLVFLAFNLFYVAFPVHVAATAGWSLAATGVFFAVLSVMMVIVQGPVLKRASRRWSDRVLILGGGAVLAASFAFFTSTDATLIYVGAALVALGNGLMWPSLLAALSRTGDSGVQGAVQGLAGSSGAVASILGLVLGGALYAVVGGGVFLIAAGVTALVLLLGYGVPVPVIEAPAGAAAD